MPNIETVELLRYLIEFDTTSDRSNLPLINFVADYLADSGAYITIDPSEDGQKANLFASIGPPDQEGGLILSGHTDTVPVAGQDWHTDPYKLVEDDGKLFARGSVDMKGFDALALSRFVEVAKHRDSLRRPLSVLLTYDEEIGCFGAKNFVRDHAELIGKPELILVGEPTELKPVVAHKGIHCFEVTIKGVSCHSSNPDNGINAIQHAARAIQHLLAFAENAQPLDPYGARDNRFTPPRSTLNIGEIKGGSAVNIVADECRFIFETRPIPGDSRDTLLESLRSYFQSAGLRETSAAEGGTYQIHEYVSSPPYDGDETSSGSQFLIDHLDHKEPLAVPFMTEASAFQNAGYNTVVCGPGSIDQAHQPNEFIAIDQLRRGTALLEKLTNRCFQP